MSSPRPTDEPVRPGLYYPSKGASKLQRLLKIALPHSQNLPHLPPSGTNKLPPAGQNPLPSSAASSRIGLLRSNLLTRGEPVGLPKLTPLTPKPPKNQRTRLRLFNLAPFSYVDQERSYLRKLRNHMADDYYTKGILGALSELFAEQDDDDDDDIQSLNTDLLGDIDGDYLVDLTLSLLKLDDVNPNKKITHLITKDDVDDPKVLERLEWQLMLTLVLTGDVLRLEKTKFTSNTWLENPHESLMVQAYKDNLWFGVRAKILNRIESEHRKVISYRRTLVDGVIDDINKFEITYDDTENTPFEQVRHILDRWDRLCMLWRTFEEMYNDKPQLREYDFINRVEALQLWLNITDAINNHSNALKVWIGNDEMDITKGRSSAADTSNKSNRIFDDEKKLLAERLMKEKDVQTVFRKRIFNNVTPWMIKLKEAYIKYGHYYELMKLPDYTHDLIRVSIIPMKLIKEIILLRLGYAIKLQNPTLMMIDQMIDDFKLYITIALEVKLGVQDYCKPDPERAWVLGDLFEGEDSDFDLVVLKCVRYYLLLLNRKLLDLLRLPTNFRTFKEPEELEEAWNYLRRVGNFIDGGLVVVADEITLLTSKLIHRLLAYFNNQVRNPQILKLSLAIQDIIRWYGLTTENFGQLRRKLARFTGEILREYTNLLVFEIPKSDDKNLNKNFLDCLKTLGHFLVFTNTVEKQGTYFFASMELAGNEQEILKIITGNYAGNDPSETKTVYRDLLQLKQLEKDNEENSIGDLDELVFPLYSDALLYVIAFCPLKPIVWEGNVVHLDLHEVPITDVKAGTVVLISKLPYYQLHITREKFLDVVLEVMMVDGNMKPVEQRCLIGKVHHELTKINRLFFKMCLTVLDSVKIVRAKCKEMCPLGGYQNLINNFFVYAKDFGKLSLRNLDSHRKLTVIMKLIHLAIEWVSFIADDCVPSDRKTFRWCVLALEFAMDMTRGFNVLVLNKDMFHRLRLKVARCMALLISHFDIMGARLLEAEKRKFLKWLTQRKQIERLEDEDLIISAYQEDVMRELDQIEENRRYMQEKIQLVGRVIDVTDLEYQFVTLLALSFSLVSIRWQKGRFIGGGTFGNVYAAVNLDTGGVMAVKEIRFHDSQLIKNIVPLIRDEMTVLEMLNHPNVVQYYGVEVHRDKVYIFMEFCEGGSLAGLLTHGRIEDEVVIQIYTLQMLEGLAYLHHLGVVHRDIKPENILLDHNGVIKFVDFGAAKVIASLGRTRGPNPLRGASHLNTMTGTPMYMSPEAITGANTAKNGVVDIWSLGCCVLEMATGRRPWLNLDNEWAIMYHIAAGNKPQLPSPDQLSQAGRDFLSKCLEQDPVKRPLAADLLNDPWMVSIRQAAFGSTENVSTPLLETSEPPPLITERQL